MYYVYILLCADSSLYTGITTNLDKRLKDHLSGKGARYTRSHKPRKIIYTEKFDTRNLALAREYEIKQWSRIQKIQKLNLRNLLQSG